MNTGHIDEILEAVTAGSYGAIMELCEKAHAAGLQAREIVTHGLSRGMVKTAKLYRKRGMYLDSIVRSAAAFQMGMACLQSHLEEEKQVPVGRIVLGVPDGPWTIGKDIVAAVLRAHDFDVFDADPKRICYNETRPHRSLGGMPPGEYTRLMAETQGAAALVSSSP